MNDALLRYTQRAKGDTLLAQSPPKPKLSIVHAQAEVVKRTDAIEKLAGQELTDGGRKA
jgi:hypothetical protein